MNKKPFIIPIILIIMLIAGTIYNQSKGTHSATQKNLTLKSDTVCKTHKDAKCITNLKALIHITNVNSKKWAVLIHGHGGNGTKYAEKYSTKYVENGYNIIAPDLRGHGETGGTLTLGYLESLDIYDWIKDLNKNWSSRYGVNVAPEIIIVHGTSLGGATTLQLATNPDIANANGSEPYTKNLTTLKVKGFVDDCGFTSILDTVNYIYNAKINESSSKTISNIYRGLYAESMNAISGFGIEKGTFDKYEDAFSEGRKFPSGSKILIIHDTQDNVVPYSNANTVANNISPGILVKKVTTTGEGHASHDDNFPTILANYIKCVENSSCNKI